MDNIVKTNGVDAYNLGTGKGYSVLEMVAAFEKAVGKEIPYKIVEPRSGDAAVCYADPTKAREELGWSARRGITEMCQDTWNWQSQNPNGYDQKINDFNRWGIQIIN